MTGSLVPLAPGVYAWLHDEVSHAATNCGVIVAEDGMTIVDTGLVPSAAKPLADALGALTPLPVRRLALTGSHIDLVGGTTTFPLPAVYGSGQTSAHLDQEANPDVWTRLHRGHAEELTSVATRPVTHTVTEAAHLCPASIAVPCRGPQFESLVVQVPSANVVFAGAVASFGVVPLGFEADFPAWIDTLETMSDWGELFVPAHGPIGGVEELGELVDYLRACVDARGDVSSMADGPWDTWVGSGYTPINVERAAMLAAGDPAPPPSFRALLGLD